MTDKNPYESPQGESFLLENESRRIRTLASISLLLSLGACVISWAGALTLVGVGLFDYLPQDTASWLRSFIAIAVKCALLFEIPTLVVTMRFGNWLQRGVAIVLAIVMLPLYQGVFFRPR